jgi:hypothetical protein
MSMPERISDNCVGLISTETASWEAVGTWNEPVSSRLKLGSYQMPQTGAQDGIELQPAQMAMLLSGIDLRTARRLRAHKIDKIVVLALK